MSDQVAKLSGDDVADVAEAIETDPAALDVAVRSVLAAGPQDTRVLLVVDQFEEVFTLCRDESERDRFINLLLDAAQGPDRRATLVLGIRADFLGRVAAYPALAATLSDQAHLLVGPMAPAELREVITRPAAQAGLAVEPDLVTTILADAAAEPGGSRPLGTGWASCPESTPMSRAWPSATTAPGSCRPEPTAQPLPPLSSGMWAPVRWCGGSPNPG